MKNRNEVKAIYLLAGSLLAGATFIAFNYFFETTALIVEALVGCWLLYKIFLGHLDARDYLIQTLNERKELHDKHSKLLAEQQKYLDQLRTKQQNNG